MPDVAAHPSESATVHNPNQQSTHQQNLGNNVSNKSSTIGAAPYAKWSNRTKQCAERLEQIANPDHYVRDSIAELRSLSTEMEQQAQKMTAAA